MKHLPLLIIIALAALLGSCIEDGFSNSPSDQPDFSVDTLDMGVIYTNELTTTRRMTVYNRHDKGLNLQSVALSGDNAKYFRLNVDGLSGSEFNDIDIRANDSIFVFIDANLPENGETVPQSLSASLDFRVNGVTSSVVITASGQDVVRKRGVVITEDTTFEAAKPYRITDSLVVAQGATLTIEAGARLLFHDKSRMVVRGTLLAQGSPEAPIVLTGDRTGDVIPDVSFDLMSRQWDGLGFTDTSTGNRLEYTEISNTCYGVTVNGDGKDIDQKKLTLINCRLRNSGDCVLTAINASVEALGCEFAEAAYGLIYIEGGDHRFDQCTVANNYLFSAIKGAAWQFVDSKFSQEYVENPVPTKALITNTITYGMGSDVDPGDLTGYDVYFKNCLFKADGEDDDNFVKSLWKSDPLFYTVRNEYLFDYRLKPDSPAIGAADISLSDKPLNTDYYGVIRQGDLGAYTYVAPDQE